MLLFSGVGSGGGGVGIGCHWPLFSGDMLGGIQLLFLSPFLVPCLRGKKRCCSLLAWCPPITHQQPWWPW